MAKVWLINPERILTVIVSNEPEDMRLRPGNRTVVKYPNVNIGYGDPIDHIIRKFEQDGFVVVEPVVKNR